MEESENDENVKKIMHVMRNAPHGTIYTYEGLEMILIMAAYEQEISVVFIDDRVYAWKTGQDTEGLEIKGFANSLITLLFQHLASLLFSEIVLPFTVKTSGSNKPLSNSLFITTGTPPA